MTEDRRKEIALMLVEARLAVRGIPGIEELKKDTEMAAAKTGLKQEELMKFYESCMPMLLKRIFGP